MKEEVFIGGWTGRALRELSQTERHQLWRRAKALHSAEGNHLARAIERLGLPYDQPQALPPDDALARRLREILASPEARSAALEATLDGLPAMAGIDGLLHQQFGEAYRRSPAAVASADAVVAELMAKLGYVAAGERPLPARCVARSGVFWRRG